MISFNYETKFSLNDEVRLSKWVTSVINSEGFIEGEIDYIFCDDNYLLILNQQFLNHNTLTDIISFDYSVGRQINGEIYISTERVKENSDKFRTNIFEELHRVMVHGILHFCGYKDKSKKEKELMRLKEDFYIDRLLNF